MHTKEDRSVAASLGKFKHAEYTEIVNEHGYFLSTYRGILAQMQSFNLNQIIRLPPPLHPFIHSLMIKSQGTAVANPR